MKQDWEDLGSEYEGSSSVLIGDVDCTVHSGLCSKHGVQGYPTIKYFTGATAAPGDSYSGGRAYATLSAWAKDNLGPSCGAENIDLCDAEQKALIESKQKLSDADLDKEIEAMEAEIKKADTDLEELLKSLQSQYEAGKKAKDDTIAAKSPGLALLRSVKRAKAGGKSEL